MAFEAISWARWRDDLAAWFVPGTRAERRLNARMGWTWSAVLAYADRHGRDALAFEPTASPYRIVADDLVDRTPHSRSVIAELRAVPSARWDPEMKIWRVLFRSFVELRRRRQVIEANGVTTQATRIDAFAFMHQRLVA